MGQFVPKALLRAFQINAWVFTFAIRKFVRSVKLHLLYKIFLLKFECANAVLTQYRTRSGFQGLSRCKM